MDIKDMIPIEQVIMYQRLMLQSLPKPTQKDLTSDIFWVCDTLGLSSGRDIENLSSQIIMRILEESSRDSGLSSECLANMMDISVGRVNHHLRNLTRSKMIYRQRKLIHLRERSMKESIRELRKDADRIFDELEEIAGEIDSIMGIPGRIAPEDTSLVLRMMR